MAMVIAHTLGRKERLDTTIIIMVTVIPHTMGKKEIIIMERKGKPDTTVPITGQDQKKIVFALKCVRMH